MQLNQRPSSRTTRANHPRPGGRFGRRSRAAFTFIEVMIVIVIIGLLAGAVSLSTRHYLDKAKQSKARSDLASLRAAVESYYAETGRYPTNDEGLGVLAPQFVAHVTPDPWGRPYQYNQPGRNGAAFEILCLGADGRLGGDGVDADLSSEDLGTPAQPAGTGATSGKLP